MEMAHSKNKIILSMKTTLIYSNEIFPLTKMYLFNHTLIFVCIHQFESHILCSFALFFDIKWGNCMFIAIVIMERGLGLIPGKSELCGTAIMQTFGLQGFAETQV